MCISIIIQVFRKSWKLIVLTDGEIHADFTVNYTELWQIISVNNSLRRKLRLLPSFTVRFWLSLLVFPRNIPQNSRRWKRFQKWEDSQKLL